MTRSTEGARVKSTFVEWIEEAWSPWLCTAALNGYEPVIKLLITEGVDLNAASKEGLTALHISAQNGHHLVVKLLLTMDRRLYIL